MNLKTLINYIKLSLELTKSNILTVMEYRVTFLTLVLGMFVNDIGLILVWVIFFQRFPSINGWELQHTILLFSFGVITFSLVFIFFGGLIHLARYIARGEMDYFLTIPKNPLWHAAASKTDISAIGDLLFGLFLFVFFTNLNFEQTILYIFLVFLASVILASFLIISQSISFFVGNFEEAAEQLLHGVFGFTMYPQNIYHGVLKVILFTLLPAFFISSLPLQLLSQFDLIWLIGLTIYAVVIFVIALRVFQKGLRRYESGNLINVRA